ncbi:diguanylate cyclase domain-containing protein [Actinoplanes sp. GCM10030250]|uniref:diguanylate cyclase domain-containing protein n=1 Tax=Actinoplanes sp. GCM10030250 TaxID=3273376 RepID=UPI00360EEDFD
MSRLRTLAGYSFEAIAVITAYLAMYLSGYGGDLPIWCLVMGLLGGAQQQPRVQRWLARGDLKRYVGLRMGLLMVTTTAFVYGTGWGAVMVVGLAMTVAVHMRFSGPHLWRPGLVWTLLCAIAGQSAIALGWAPSYIPAPAVHFAALSAVVLSALLIRTIAVTDVERGQAVVATRATERRYRALIHDSADVFAIYQSDGTIPYVSPAIRQLAGLEPEAVDLLALKNWAHPEDVPLAVRLLEEAPGPGAQLVPAEIRVRATDGTYRWTEATIRDLTGDPDVRGHLINLRDIHDRKTSQQQLAHAATHDALTGLVNRAAFGRALDTACAAGDTAVLFVDLDGFKQVNDTYGHDAGDAMLIAAAEILIRWSPRGATVGRFGGDEFGVIIGWPNGSAEQAAERILAGLSEPMVFAGQELVIRASIGVAVTEPGRTSGAGELLRRADLAMYEAKRAGTHGFEVAPPPGVLIQTGRHT